MITLLPIVLIGATGGPVFAQNGEERTIRDGVFSDAQVRRGEAVFGNICSACHNRAQFVGDGGFQKNWEGRTFFDVFDQLRNTMPNDNPGGLSRREYVDVLIYLLRQGGHPAGEADLAVTDASLKAIRIVPPAAQDALPAWLTPRDTPRPRSP
jgi:mono/diheme cytochrome c family protein